MVFVGGRKCQETITASVTGQAPTRWGRRAVMRPSLLRNVDDLATDVYGFELRERSPTPLTIQAHTLRVTRPARAATAATGREPCAQLSSLTFTPRD